ncbi:transglutaminase-like cysteine peptidase [Marinibaculum pumilum]|uniref:Transglutaminase-like cysteine peptidase n=1 Tax=Marinibaculum pumilum TaxID=1766165 RepID=A0ABV7L8D8_9PROT
MHPILPLRIIASLRIITFVLLSGLIWTGTPAVTGLGGSAMAATQGTKSFFQTWEFRRENLKPFPKWTSALERYFKERGRTDGSCTDKTFNRCHWEEWQKMLADLKGKKDLKQLRAVNAFFNDRPYITDPINWGIEDYWAAPGQFLTKDGDCEDYAIAKYLSLRALGWPPEDLRLVVLQDLNLRIPHAILIVRFAGRYLILDNQIKQVVDQSAIRHYKPIYSLNESAWWLHR